MDRRPLGLPARPSRSPTEIEAAYGADVSGFPEVLEAYRAALARAGPARLRRADPHRPPDPPDRPRGPGRRPPGHARPPGRRVPGSDPGPPPPDPPAGRPGGRGLRRRRRRPDDLRLLRRLTPLAGRLRHLLPRGRRPPPHRQLSLPAGRGHGRRQPAVPQPPARPQGGRPLPPRPRRHHGRGAAVRRRGRGRPPTQPGGAGRTAGGDRGGPGRHRRAGPGQRRPAATRHLPGRGRLPGGPARWRRHPPAGAIRVRRRPGLAPTGQRPRATPRQRRPPPRPPPPTPLGPPPYRRLDL